MAVTNVTFKVKTYQEKRLSRYGFENSATARVSA